MIHSMNPRIGGPTVAVINSVVSGARAGVESEVAVVIQPGEMSAPWWRELETRCEREKVQLMSFPVGAPRLSARFYDPSPALWRNLPPRLVRVSVLAILVGWIRRRMWPSSSRLSP